jgi:hypothetical protein
MIFKRIVSNLYARALVGEYFHAAQRLAETGQVNFYESIENIYHVQDERIFELFEKHARENGFPNIIREEADGIITSISENETEEVANEEILKYAFDHHYTKEELKDLINFIAEHWSDTLLAFLIRNYSNTLC